jgi:uncharacterized protein with PIN domain
VHFWRQTMVFGEGSGHPARLNKCEAFCLTARIL